MNKKANNFSWTKLKRNYLFIYIKFGEDEKKSVPKKSQFDKKNISQSINNNIYANIKRFIDVEITIKHHTT